jgi:hypothetical protein
MCIEHRSFHDQLVADFSPDDENNDFFVFYIIQDSQIADTQLECSKWVRSKLLDRPCRGNRLFLQPRQDGRFDNALCANWQRSQLRLGDLRDADLIWHGRSL